jgi:hypothetical protein
MFIMFVNSNANFSLSPKIPNLQFPILKLIYHYV